MIINIGKMLYRMTRFFCLGIFVLGLQSFSAGASWADHQETIKVNRLFAESQKAYAFSGGRKIYGLSINGNGELQGTDSLIRIILVDRDRQERLVYEMYPLLADGPVVQATGACEETHFLDAVYPVSLKIQLVNASFRLAEVTISNEPLPAQTILLHEKQRAIRMANNDKIARLNAQIRQKGLKWTAGETSISRLSFQEKLNLFGSAGVPNLQGAEYYTGGIYDVKSLSLPALRSDGQGSDLTAAFDWRQRHGADNPESPYFDGDSTGSGWMTPVRDQGTCGSCWAHGTLGAVEALVNIYFNQHIDLNLAEQDLLSCSGGGNCESGFAGDTLRYIRDYGVVDEACLPYSESDGVCADKCRFPNDIILVDYDSTTYLGGADDEHIKRRLIQGGPGAFLIFSWNHYVTLVGYSTDPADDRTVWVFKNSWGEQWGENGYGSIKCGQLGETGCEFLGPQAPVRSIVTPRTIDCMDLDGDGYYNWGISEVVPETCPHYISSMKDCDDSDPYLGYMDDSGGCVAIRPVDIDIMPGDGLNCIGLGATGTIPVAVLSNDGFDATSVDVASVTFGGAHSTEWRVTDADGDSDQDLLLHLNIADLKIDANATEASLEGIAQDGIPVIGKDKVCILPDLPPYFENISLPSTVTFPGKTCFSGSAMDDFGLQEIQMSVAGPGIGYTYTPEIVSGTKANLETLCFNSSEDRFAGKSGSYTITLTVYDSVRQEASQDFSLDFLIKDSDGDGLTDDLDAFPNDPGEQQDADSDGSGDNADCDDVNPAIHPGAEEVENGVDDNCDGLTDEGFFDEPIDPIEPAVDSGSGNGGGGGGGGCFILSITN